MPIGKLNGSRLKGYLWRMSHTSDLYRKMMNEYYDELSHTPVHSIKPPNFPFWSRKRKIDTIKDIAIDLFKRATKKFRK